MKEDILEQVVEDYLQSLGYFTIHNVKYRPESTDPGYVSNKDSVHSDIDVIALHPTHQGAGRVKVVTCKSWQAGFDPRGYWHQVELAENKGKYAGRAAWMPFRELTTERWGLALRRKIFKLTGQEEFTYLTAVTVLKGKDVVQRAAAAAYWTTHPTAQQNLRGNPMEIVAMDEMVKTMLRGMTTTVQGSMLGRTLQLLKTAKCLRPDLG